MNEWSLVRKAAGHLVPKHTETLSHVEQERLPPMLKDRGAEQGDVDGPLECSLALGMVAAETRKHVAAQQAARTLPWIGIDDPLEEQRLQAERVNKVRSNIFNCLGLPNTSELMTRDTPYKKIEAWQINGTSTMVTSSVTRSWCRPTCKNLMLPTSNLEQNEIRR